MIFTNHLKLANCIKRITLLLCCVVCFFLSAQDPYVDSLKLEIKTAKHDSTRCIVLNELAEYIYPNTPDSALMLWKKTIKIATENLKTTKDKDIKLLFSDLLSWAYLDCGVYYQSRSGPDEALKYFEKALAISTAIDGKACMANCLVDIGHLHYRKGHVLQALDFYHKGLKIYEKIEAPSSMSYCLGSIGNLYVGQNELENGLHYLNRSAKMYEKDSNNTGVAFALTGIADM